MNPLLLDTCALIYFFFNTGDKKLSNEVITQIQNGNFCILSISFAELECLVQRKRIIVPTGTIDNLLYDLKEISKHSIIDITSELWLKSIRLTWEDNKDPCDRLMVAYALEHDLNIVSSDRKIKAFYKKTIL